MTRQTPCEILEPGTYRVRVGAWGVENGRFGRLAVMQFDLLDEGLTHRFIEIRTSAKLTAGPRPSRLYSWISALVFAGESLPAGYDLDATSLLNREALALIEVVEEDGVRRNRIAQLFPLPTVSERPDKPQAKDEGGEGRWEL